MVRSKNTEGISHPSGPAGQESRPRGREIGSGLIRGMEETVATGKSAVELNFQFLR